MKQNLSAHRQAHGRLLFIGF